MASIEPSEELLDRHFRQQLAVYKDVDQSRALHSDRLLMVMWMKVFERTPFSQKLARNSLMLLMHGHLKDFGFLKAPFTDVRNCSRNLNELVDEYKGHPCKKVTSQQKIKDSTKNIAEPQRKEVPLSSLSRTALLKRTFSHIPRSRKLEPIKEVSEPSEKDPTTSTSLASVVTIIRTANTRSISSQSSSDSHGTCSECVNEAEIKSVKQRIQALEEELSKNDQHPLSVSSMENVRKCYEKGSSNSGDSARSCIPQVQGKLKKITNVIDQVTRRSSAVKNLKDCFEEMAERLRNTAETAEYSVPTGQQQKIPPPVPPRNFRRSQAEVPAQMSRQTGGQSQPPVFFKDKTVQELLVRREKLRVQCLEYYNLDGTMKDVKDMPVPPIDTKRNDQRVKGFIIGAYRALERLKRWRGKRNQLKLFRTCFRGFRELGGFWKLQALDRRFERVALRWHRSKLLVCQRNTWRRYRRYILVQKPSPSKQDLLQVRHQLELQEELQRERMVHLDKIKELCKTHCSGVIQPDVLRKMLGRLNEEYGQLAGDLKSVVREKEQLFQ
ncbi:hypothetical protein KR084_007864 [Drosophila pseudotakahashii]|nr:hypothetical protein KR084_007864 [Drosophila pseudotakahashii]